MKAYMEVTKHRLRPYKDLLYLDTAEFYSVPLLRKHGVWFKTVATFSNPEKRLRIVVIRIPEWQEGKFADALLELLNKLLICGYPEYGATFDEVVEMLDDGAA